MNIVISGYYGFNNAGDELILESMVADMRRREPGVLITVLSMDPARTTRAHGVRAVDRWDWWGVFRAIRACDVLVSGGGGLFQDRTGSLSVYYYLLLIRIAKLLGKKVFVYAVGVNGMRPLNQRMTARALSHADRVTVRENDSRDLLAAWGCTAPIEVTADPVLLNEVAVSHLKDDQPRVALILRPPLTGPWPVEVFAKLADSLSQRLRAQVVFVPFHLAYDLSFSLAVMNAMQTPARIVEWSDFRELYAVLAEADLVISQRLHGLILAALYGIPLIGISDDPKIDRFLRELGQKNIFQLGGLNHYALLAVILDVWEWREDFRRNATRLLPSFKSRARRTVDALFSEEINGPAS